MAAAGVSRALPFVEGMAVLGSSRSATCSEPCFADLAAERVSGLASCAGLGFCAGRLPRLPRSSLSSSSVVAAVSAHVLLLRRRRNRESVRGNCARRAFILDPLGRDTGRGGGGVAAEPPPPLRSKRVVLGVRSAGQFNTLAAETIVSSPPKSPSSEVSPPKSPLAVADISPPKSPPPPQETGGNDDQSGPVEISGPINLDLEIDPFAFPKATPLQTVGSVFLTGTIALLLLRSLRRRTRNAKRVRFRSDRTVEVGNENPRNSDNSAGLPAATKAAEALSPPASASSAAAASPPSVFGTFSGALVAAGIAYVLYKFTLVVEGGFAKKAISANYSVRNISITVRTIIAGICYLATFVFAANSIGLTLYAFQLLLGQNPSDVEESNEEGGGSSLQGRDTNLEEAGSDKQSNSKNAKSGDDNQSLGE